MKRKLLLISMIFVMVLSLTGCASQDRFMTDIKSEVGNGLQRTVTVYTANEDVIATYEGKIDIESADGDYVKFDLDGKRYIYYNCFVETIAEIE